MLLVSVVYSCVCCYLSVLCIEVLVVTCQCCDYVEVTCWICYLSALCIEVLVATCQCVVVLSVVLVGVTCQCCVLRCWLLLVSTVT